MLTDRDRLLCAAALLGVLGPAMPGLAYETATLGEHAPAATATEFEVFLPPAPNPALDALVLAQATPGSAEYHHFLTPAEYRARFGTDPAVMDAAAELRAAGFVVLARHAHGMRVRGSAAAVERAFGTRLDVARFADGHATLAAERALALTPALAAHGAVIAAFSPVIRAHVDSVADAAPAASGVTPFNRTTAEGPYWFDDLKQAYQLPAYTTLDGSGVTIGILVSASYNLPDIEAYFAHEGLATPALSEVEVDGGSPFSTDASKEVHLDIQQSGGMAPKASIVHYNIPDLSDAHIQDALVEIDEDDAVDIVSMSFGGAELGYAPSYNGGQGYFDILRANDVLFRQGNAEGITFVASSGDLGAHDIPALPCLLAGAKPGCGGFQLSPEFPASSPHVAGVGGTNLVTTYDAADPRNLNSAYISENAFYDRLQTDPFYGTPASNPRWGSGGGVSIVFKQPSWQAAVAGGNTMRTVPDVAGHMGGCIDVSVVPCKPHRSSDVVLVSGYEFMLHGTSASAPDFAGLLALKAQAEHGRLGLVNPTLYAMAAAQAAGTGPVVFRQDIHGDNDFYKTTPGYNLVLGLGTLYGSAFVGLPNGPFAGVPQTPTNP